MTNRAVYDFSRLSENDVREEIIRPWLNELGYRSSTENNIRTEITLKYSRIYLGRKNAKKDPELVGRADYICDVAGFGRWVIEAKAPQTPLTEDDANQAHSYAAHPEVGAIFYLVTNGYEWQLYRTSAPSVPVLTWRYDELDANAMLLQNLLSPEAIRKLHEVNIDVGQPLARGYKSSLVVAGGYVEYADLQAGGQAIESHLGGLRNAVPEGKISRNSNGQIEFAVKLLSANSAGDAFAKAIEMEWLHLATTQEYLSVDPEMPTIATFSHTAYVPEGTTLGGYPGGPPQVQLPFELTVNVFAEVVAFLEEDKLKGTFALDIQALSPHPMFQFMPENMRSFTNEGQFTLTLK